MAKYAFGRDFVGDRLKLPEYSFNAWHVGIPARSALVAVCYDKPMHAVCLIVSSAAFAGAVMAKVG